MTRRSAASICPYCAVGCGYYIEVEDGRPAGIRYMPEHPASEGALCPKGNAVLDILNSRERLRYPLKRVGEGWERISWKEALDLVAKMHQFRLDGIPVLRERTVVGVVTRQSLARAVQARARSRGQSWK